MNISKKLPSRFEAVPEFISVVIDLLKKEHHVTEDDIFQVKLALEESLTNAVKHGNKLDPAMTVDVSVVSDDNCLTITVQDQGKGFDPNNVPDPTSKEKLTKTSGRGVYLIKKFMDEVNYFDAGRGIRMVKILGKKSKGGG